MDRNEIAEIFREISVLLELKGENRFKSGAYANAARTLETLNADLDVLIREDRLKTIKGMGSALCEKVIELHTSGKLAYHEELKNSLPPGLLECLRVPGLGPKKVKALWEKLNIESMDQLKSACEQGRVSNLDGFGTKTQAKIIEGISHLEKYRGQFLLFEATETATPILLALRQSPDVQQVEIAGSLRRQKEVIRDLDFVVATENPTRVMEFFTSRPEVQQVTNQGKTKSSVILQNGMQADLRCVTSQEFPFALNYFTGSKEHNVALRQRAIAQGKKLNEYGLFEKDSEVSVSCQNEAELYRQLDLIEIPPELREDMGEISSAEQGKLPLLIRKEDLRGTFHTHTVWSDGRHTIEEMARTAMELGWEYLGISDHSKTSAIANGLDEKRLLSQIKEISQLNQQFESEGRNFRLFAGSEVDIISDGSLDFSDEILAQLDFAVASIHFGFTPDEATQTERVIRAIRNPYITMLGHATGRLLLEREPYKLNLPAVIHTAAETGTLIELNTTASRMELDWRWWKQATEQGVTCSINPDAHACHQLSRVYQGIGIARKGWLCPQHVLNTRSLHEVTQFLKSTRPNMK